jgi:hypothetical protein
MKRLAWLAAIGLGLIVACSPAATTTPAAPTSAPQQITREMVFQPQPGEWVLGPEDAIVTIIEWGDFQ